MTDLNEYVLKAIRHYQQSLDKYSASENTSRLLHSMEKLNKLPIKVCHLQETGIGRTVNSLRKLGGEVGEVAKTLVAKWKEIVLVEEVGEKENEDSEQQKQEESKSPDHGDENIENASAGTNVGQECSSSHDSNRKDSYRGDSDSHREESDSHRKDCESHRKDKDSHRKDSEYRRKDTDNHRKDRDSHRKDNDSHRKDSDSYSKNSDNHRKDNESHRKNRDKHSKKRRYSESGIEENSSDSEDQKNRKKEEHKSKKKQESSSDEEIEKRHKSNKSKRREHSEERSKSKKSKHREESDRENKKSKHRDSSKSKRESSEKESSGREESSSSKHKRDRDSKAHSSHSDSKDKKDKHKKEQSIKEEDTVHQKPKTEDKKHKKHSDKSKHKSSSSEKIDSKPKKSLNTVKLVNGIDSESGASFAEALGMLEPSVKAKSKKKSNMQLEKPKSSASATSTSLGYTKNAEEIYQKYDEEDEEEYVPSLLKEKKLEPLDISISSLLPSITPNYRPLAFPIDNQPKRVLTDDEALSRVIATKNQRTKVYSGNKTVWNKVPTLFEICTRILQDNMDALEYTGGVPYSILKPILEKANPDQLFMLEHHNPYLIEDSDELWLLHCQKEFRNKQREELESWREMYMRCLDEREAKLKALTANIKQAQDKSVPVRSTKMAYMDDIVKPPRNIARKQAKNGTAMAIKKPQTPTQRLTQLAVSGEAGKVSVPNPGSRTSEKSSHSMAAMKPKKAPLMAKTLSLFKNRFGRR